MYDPFSQSSLQAQNEQKTENMLLKGKLAKDKRLIKNNFMIQIIINIFIVISYILAICWYQWYQLQQGDDPVWLNFIYIKYPNKFVFWESWIDESKSYCKDQNQQYNQALTQYNNSNNSNNVYLTKQFQSQYKLASNYDECITSFETLRIIGVICFVFILIGFLCNIVQCIILYKLKRSLNTEYKYTTYYQLIVLGNIFSFCIPVILYFWVTVFQKSLNFSLSKFGVCYLICFICILIYFLSLIYFRITRKKIKDKEYMQGLLDEADNIATQPRKRNKTGSSDSSEKIIKY